MIIKLLFELIYNVFSILTLPINLPSLPNEVMTYIDTVLQYIGVGLGILSNFTHLQYLLLLFGIIIAIDVGILVYKLVMFVIKKYRC